MMVRGSASTVVGAHFSNRNRNRIRSINKQEDLSTFTNNESSVSVIENQATVGFTRVGLLGIPIHVRHDPFTSVPNTS